jgi:hypothetical protein
MARTTIQTITCDACLTSAEGADGTHTIGWGKICLTTINGGPQSPRIAGLSDTAMDACPECAERMARLWRAIVNKEIDNG